jgi:23S rRNA (cytidine1920-2'-O)/16S rRNA (cytidine1409-2'-O)-methyltransferase
MDRIDRILVKLQKTDTRSKARALILSGKVFVNGRKIDKAGVMISGEENIEIKPPPSEFVSRGGDKLEHALKVFSLNPEKMVALDGGASTGGFTDCLLRHGAQKVYAVDVGYGQLDYKLQKDPRVIAIFRKNIRYMTLEEIGEQVDLVTLDLSFISLTKVLVQIKELIKDIGLIVALVKPQFEAGPHQVQRGGVIKDPKIHEKVLKEIIEFSDNISLNVIDLTPSPLLGPSGNREFFLLMRKRLANQEDKMNSAEQIEILLSKIKE